LRAAISEGRVDVEKLFRGSDGTGGAFGALAGALDEYTKAGGLVPHAQDRLGDQLTKLSDRISDMEERLAIRRAALQKEFIAADQAIAQLNAQKTSLNSLSSSLGQF
jgi:flagellar hook-associated protein 2